MTHSFGHRVKFGNDPEKHVDFSAVTHVAKDKGMVPYDIVRGENCDAAVEARGEKYAPAKISAMLAPSLCPNSSGRSKSSLTPKAWSITPGLWR